MKSVPASRVIEIDELLARLDNAGPRLADQRQARQNTLKFAILRKITTA